jgi:hypothetical protein
VDVAHEEPTFGEFADEGVELSGGTTRFIDVGETFDDAFAIGPLLGMKGRGKEGIDPSSGLRRRGGNARKGRW